MYAVGDMQRLAGQFVGMMRKVSMAVPNDRPVCHEGLEDQFRSLKECGKACMLQFNNKPPQLFILLPPEYLKHTHDQLKRYCVTELPDLLVSQGIVSNKIKNDNRPEQRIANICMKGPFHLDLEGAGLRQRRLTLFLCLLQINIKMGGTNWTGHPDDLPRKAKTCVMGADVVYTGPGSRAASIAAVVSKLDLACSDYGCEMRMQDQRVEIIQCVCCSLLLSHLPLRSCC